MIITDNYTSEGIHRIFEYFKKEKEIYLNQKLIEEHLYCLGILESFSKIGMNFVLIGNMATYLMCQENLYLPNNLEIMVNKQDFLIDYLSEANQLFKAIKYQSIIQKDNYILYQYTYKSAIDDVVNVYLNIRLEDHIINEVASVAINKPYLSEKEHIYRIKTPYAERLFAEALYHFSPKMLLGKIQNNDYFPLFVIKNLLDSTQLYNYLGDFELVINEYYKLINKFETNDEKFKFDHFIWDTYNSLINVYCQGKYRTEHYKILSKGIKSIQNYIINDLGNEDQIFKSISYPLLACSCIYRNINCLNIKIEKKKRINFFNYSKVNLMKDLDKNAFNVVVTAIEIFDNLKIIEKIYKNVS